MPKRMMTANIYENLFWWKQKEDSRQETRKADDKEQENRWVSENLTGNRTVGILDKLMSASNIKQQGII